MQLDVTDPVVRTYRLPSFNLRWSGVFAGLVVGIATNLFLMLLGAAAGLAVFEIGESNASIPLAVAIWNTICMVLAAFCGGYVAARSTGMRRASDGLLHGAVAWGATMLLSALLATSATGAALGSIFALSSNRTTAAEPPVASLNLSDRQEAARVLESRFGLTVEQANRAVDQAMALSGHEENATPAGRAAAERSLHTASIASGWLSAAILLSALAAMGGGAVGARGARRLAGAQLRRAVIRQQTEAPPDQSTVMRAP